MSLFEDSDNEDIIMDTPINTIDPEFRLHVLNTKRNVYNSIVFQKNENTKDAQDVDTVLQLYLRIINNIYLILQEEHIENMQTIDWSLSPWNEIPDTIRDDITKLIVWYFTFLQNNHRIEDRIPYQDYIENSFHVYPYHQTNDFNTDE